MKPEVQSRILRVETLSDELKARMFKLFSEYYQDVTYEQFLADLAEKTHIFLFTDEQSLAGFSTIFRKKLPQVGSGLFLFSGDTVLRRDYWGSKLLQTAFFRFILESKLISPLQPVYWMLISKGFKTYLMMRRNFAVSFPALGAQTPEKIQNTMDRFYSWKFGQDYLPSEGVIRFKSAKGSVKGDLADPADHAIHDPEVRHFLSLNPGYRDGTELACIAEIRFSDFIGHIPKYFLPKSFLGK